MSSERAPDKVAIIGVGAVGATTAYAIMNAGAASEIVLIGNDSARVSGEVMDLDHGSSFVPPVRISAGTYEDCRDAAVIIISAGVRQQPGETRMDLLKSNIDVIRDIVPKAIAGNRNCILLVVTNPVDALTYAALKISGLPPGQVIGSGTLLDTARFRFLLSERCGVATQSVHAHIVGEHGDDEVAAWSVTNIAGMSFDLFCRDCSNACTMDDKDAIFQSVKNAAYEIIEKKGATYYAIGLAVRRIVQAILRNENAVLGVSSLMQGFYGINNVCLSLPSIVNKRGVARVLELPLNDSEVGAFRASAEALRSKLDEVNL